MRRIKNTNVLYTGRVGVRMRAPRGPRTTRRIVKRVVQLLGGPLSGARVWLSAHDGMSTLPIVCRGQAGHYANGCWLPA